MDIEAADLPAFVAASDGTLLYSNKGLESLVTSLKEAATGSSGSSGPSDQLAAAAEQGRGIRLAVGGKQRLFHLRETWLDTPEGERAILGYLVPEQDQPAEAETRVVAERFEDVIDLLSDWIWETDSQGRLTYVSPRVTEVLGYAKDDIIGRRIDLLVGGAVPPEMKATEPAPFHGWGVVLSGKQGAERRFRFNGRPYYDGATAAFLGYRGTAVDITDLVAQEASLRQVVEAAEAANRAKSEFLANTSHELRTPLNAIIGFTEVMSLEKFGPLGNPRYREYVDDVLESAHHLLGVINDILDVAKIESGKLELVEDEVEPQALINRAVRLIADRASHFGLALRTETAPELPLLLIDEQKLSQVLVNLLTNAVKFTPRGGEIVLAALLDDSGRFVFRVRDTGIGIAPEHLSAVLSPFGQAESQLSRRFEGTGLGLPLSNALIKMHGGRLEIVSNEGAGTTVSAILPAQRLRQR